jgi:hypothetical protein
MNLKPYYDIKIFCPILLSLFLKAAPEMSDMNSQQLQHKNVRLIVFFDQKR